MTRVALIFCLAGASLVTGCDSGDPSFQSAPAQQVASGGPLKPSTTGNRRLRVWTDPETGCQYLLLGRSGRGSITPRLRSDGLPMCKAVTGAARP